MKVLLDTNFLIDLLRFKVEMEEIEEALQQKCEFLILSSNIQELEKIARDKSKAGKFAKAALKLLSLKDIKILRTEKNPDDAFLSIANKNTIIATNDSRLRKKIKKLGIKTIYLRGRKKLEVM
jgi:rRNA-processing protein FCF1